MSRGPYLTPEKEAEIRHLRYQERLSAGEVASRMGVSRSTVGTIAPPKTRRLSPRDERVIGLLRQGKRQIEVKRELGLSQDLVYRIARRARSEGLLDGSGGNGTGNGTAVGADEGGGEAASLKDRILRKIVNDGPFPTTQKLTDALRNGSTTPWDLHEVVHLLHSLRRQELVTFRTASNGSNVAGPRAISATKRGIDAVTVQIWATDAEAATVAAADQAATDATSEAIEAPGPSTALVEGSDGGNSLVPFGAGEDPSVAPVADEDASEWRLVPILTSKAVDSLKAAIDSVAVPLLAALVAREAEREANKVKAARFLEAAALLADVDKEASDALLDRASALEGQPFTPIEAEYLAFAHAVDSSFTTLRDTIDTL